MDEFAPGDKLRFHGKIYTILERHDGWISVAGKDGMRRRIVVEGEKGEKINDRSTACVVNKC